MSVLRLDLAQLSLGQFLNGLFELEWHGDKERAVQLCSFPGSPRDKTASWTGRRWDPVTMAALPVNHNQYFSVGLLRPDSIGRGDDLVYANPLIPLDDVGSKVKAEDVRRLVTAYGLLPAAVVETSRGNHSIYYKVVERMDLERGARVRAALGKLKLSDPAVHDRSRYMRLPYGINGKVEAPGSMTWRVRLKHWDPLAVTSYHQWEAMIAAVGVQLRDVHVPVAGERAASMSDPWVALAAEVGLDPHQGSHPGVVLADCPFTAEHSDEDPTGFAFVNWGRCHCHHGHCAERRSGEFLEKMSEMFAEQNPGQRAADWLAARAFEAAGPIDQYEIRG